MFYCVYKDSFQVINFSFRWEKKCFCWTKLYVKCIYTCILPLKLFIPYFVAIFVFSGTALLIKYSISWSEISANCRDAIVSFFFSKRFLSVMYMKLRDWSKLIEERFSLAIHNCFLSADRKQWKSQSNSQIHNRT